MGSFVGGGGQRFCTGCGAERGDGHRFCASCGSPFDGGGGVPAGSGASSGLSKGSSGLNDAAASAWAPKTGVPIAVANGVINVESGHASIATRIFEPCDCMHGGRLGAGPCDLCGRSIDNYVSVLAGGGDGLYPVLIVGRTPGVLLGVQVMFTRNGPDEHTQGDGAFEWLMANARPLPLADWTEGFVYFSEASAGFNGRDCICTGELPEGDNLVVAWLYEDAFLGTERETRPIALGYYTGEYRDRVLELAGPITREAARAECDARSNSDDLLHMSHMIPVWSQALQLNADLFRQADLLIAANSFLLQGALHEDEECARLVELLVPRRTIEDRRAIATGYQWRGQRDAAIAAWTDLALEEDSEAMINLGHILLDTDQAAAESWTRKGMLAADDHESLAIGINNLAYSVYLRQRRFVEAQVWLEVAINLDVPFQSNNARSNLGQVHFYRGDYEAARPLFERIVSSGDGPLEEAKDFLARMGTEAPGLAMPDAPREMRYSEAWRTVDIFSPAPQGQTDQFYYDLVLGHLAANGAAKAALDTTLLERAAFISGVADGIMESMKAPIRRDIVVQAARDAITHRVIERPAS